ncbi:orotate phosphoribosyltransferase [Coxiella endosymbiont of Amblyomma sculptum]|uniref:orotate phosphoribosyltransferase n=1 Tax=Coxiella endosymbiont of Amblyomma sculptum TaxID=2487929 RepID=UPI00132EF123|nr:orotate phosphoribosyltransferase [Coxiella endosymbiont of Amblyomma sculptum]QHG92471.1 orotate phosphoribosyltransferase [Coxiella endosymbiont of Amblyomma sculptum]
MSRAKKIARILLDINAVTLNFRNPYRYASGLLSPIYCDNRLIMSYPEQRKIIVDSLLHLIEEKNFQFDVVSGIATAGIPHSAWIADRLNSPMVYVRGKKKNYGKKNRIEGKLRIGQKVLVVEDLISSGNSIITSIRILRQFAVVEHCIAIFSYQLFEAQRNFTKANISCYALSDFRTLIDVAFSIGHITEEEKQKALIWNKNPENWNPQIVFSKD